MMNDYKELICELKELSEEEKEFASNSGDIYLAEMLALAADAIEQLVKERNASIADFTIYIKHMEDGRKAFSCEFCNEENCDSCKHCSNFEWREVTDNN